MAKDLAPGIRSLEKPKVALLAFPYHDGRESNGSSIVSERLTTQMAELKGMRIVERALIAKIMEEHHLSASGLIDPTSAKKWGKILGVDVIVTGTLIDLNNGKTEVNARALNTETGEVVAATRALVEKIWNDRARSRSESRPNRPETEESADAPEKNEAIEIGYPAGRGGRGYGRR